MESQGSEVPINKSISINLDEEATTSNLIVETPLIPIEVPNTHSLLSTSSKTNDYPGVCRICHHEGTINKSLISPCYCADTMKYVHQSCLQHWMKNADAKLCERCRYEYVKHSELKPFKEWKMLDLTAYQRCKIIFSVPCILFAVLVIFWTRYILIEKSRNEIKDGKPHWPFWTKFSFIVIAAWVFLYVQLIVYFRLCIRWVQFNQHNVILSRGEQPSKGIIPFRKKESNTNSENHIITSVDANDLPPINTNTTSIAMPGQITV
ncbi:unnamed protein product [Adineta steineri]|uniref:RING-CH-type domain-containing protein n=1 Tax=Adineta steineri TaxID=433720 RepID=A0A814Q316_9BILA|nr:unnamed protein product [Adineta steineri]